MKPHGDRGSFTLLAPTLPGCGRSWMAGTSMVPLEGKGREGGGGPGPMWAHVPSAPAPSTGETSVRGRTELQGRAGARPAAVLSQQQDRRGEAAALLDFMYFPLLPYPSIYSLEGQALLCRRPSISALPGWVSSGK